MINKTLFMETTKISAASTVGKIQQILGNHGATAILMEYDNKEIIAVSFKVIANSQEIPFRLPCRWERILNILMSKSKRHRNKEIELKEKAKRVAWRQILRWVEAQLALVDTEMVKIQEVFMPYLQVNTGQTLYERLEDSEYKMLEYKG